ncbi:hypothetical protein HK405_015698, partial [Cladochytrium tenue]
MKVLIIGGGIAGPALALALVRSNHEVELFDRVVPQHQRLQQQQQWPGGRAADPEEQPSSDRPTTEWEPEDIGGAVLVNENVLRVLERLGVRAAVVAASTPVVRHELCSFNGRPYAVFDTFDGPDYITGGVLRSVLTRALYRELVAAGVRLQTGKRLVGIEQHGPPDDASPAQHQHQQPEGAVSGGVTARFADGSEAHGDVLVGADGVHSAVRTLLFPTARPRASPYLGYFAVSPLHGRPAPQSFAVYVDAPTGNYAFVMPAGDEFVHWGLFETRAPVAGKSGAGGGGGGSSGAGSSRGGSDRGSLDSNDRWEVTGELSIERDRMYGLVEKWGLPREFRTLVRDVARVVRVGFSSMDPMPRWQNRDCVLIADSCHAMLPFIGQGAGMGLEDALTLAVLLDRLPGNPRLAFQYLHELRARRVEKVAALSELLAQRSAATSHLTSAIGKVIMKLFSYVSRFSGQSLFSNDIIRHDCYEAAESFLASK